MLKGLSTCAVVAAVAFGSLGACVDAKARFDEYGDRVPIVDASTVDRPQVPISDINGNFYLAIRAVNFNATLHLFTTWTIDLDGNPVTLAGTYQPLSVDRDMPANPPRLPVGDEMTSAAVAVDETASFVAPVVGNFDGNANPISPASLGSAVSLVGTIKSADLVCGTVMGAVCLGSSAPCEGATSVEPATFAAVRVTDVNSLPPLPPTFECPP